MSKPMGLLEAARAFSNGTLDRKEYIDACTKRADEVDPWLKAFTYRVPSEKLSIADEGPLAGIPVGVKDIIATAGILTTNGSKIYADNVPDTDAEVVSRIKKLGGTIFAKTVTTEFAWRSPGPTVNPWNPEHTPGGSSSGSAASVAAGIVPLALGTQTLGSVVRPGAFCGVVGFKPTFGSIPLGGVHPLAQSLDHVGYFTRSIDDAAYAFGLLSDVGVEASEIDDLANGIDTGVRPKIAVLTPSFAGDMSDEQKAAFENAIEALRTAGAHVEPIDLPASYWEGVKVCEMILAAEAAAIHAENVERYVDKTSPQLKDLVAQGAAISAPKYIAALRMQTELREQLPKYLSGFDAALTVPATGEAPKGLTYTGDTHFCALWTLLGVPALSMPVARSANGLPLAIQLVGGFGEDQHLLQTAKWVEQNLTNPFAEA